MISSEGRPGARELPAGTTREELAAAGWERAFIADEPRLSEAVETYLEIGYEVALLPVPEDDGQCTECMRKEPGRYRLIYIRKAGGGAP